MRELTLRRGYSATGVDEVCAAAGVSKGSFYHHFSSKEDIALAAVDSWFSDVAQALAPPPQTPSDRAVERLDTFVERAIEVCTGPLFVNGCLLGVLALDLSETHPNVRQALGDRFTALEGGLAVLISAAAAERGLRLPSRTLARQFLAVLEGAIVLTKAQSDLTVVADALDLYHQHLRLLLDRKEQHP